MWVLGPGEQSPLRINWQFPFLCHQGSEAGRVGAASPVALRVGLWESAPRFSLQNACMMSHRAPVTL